MSKLGPAGYITLTRIMSISFMWVARVARDRSAP